MTRRDTIIVAAFVNLGLLACLFVTATRKEDPAITEPIAASYEIHEPENQIKADDHLLSLNQNDDVDQALKDFLPEDLPLSHESLPSSGFEQDLQSYLAVEIPIPAQKEPEAKPVKTDIKEEKYVHITVKKGDALERIAKANGTTARAIKEANGLMSDKVRVGQVLKVPVGTNKTAYTPAPEVKNSASDAEYYVVKSGDNPWKIAKIYNVKFEDILRLNNMTEEKARNLKIGDRIRVK